MGNMQDELARAQHYRTLERQLRDSAELEQDEKRRADLVSLAEQYSRLADKLISQHAERESR
jgi:hypothetical protein